MQLQRDAEHQRHVERVLVGLERPGRRAAGSAGSASRSSSSLTVGNLKLKEKVLKGFFSPSYFVQAAATEHM